MNQRAFSLIELSIVIVIIGLIVGGIIGGSALIRAGELRSVVSDVSKYTAAVNTFKQKYDAFPGDMINATSYWGAINATPATCYTTANTGPATCDGNGDGHLVPTVVNEYHETFHSWKHLANEGL